MKLEALIHPAEIIESTNWNPGAVIAGVTKDSRQVRPGFLFVACSGAGMDGHDFVAQAIAQGAVAFVYERSGIESSDSVAGIRVQDSRVTFADVLKRWNHFEDQKLALIGVTGTNGKTTITQLLYRLIKTKMPAGVIGTLTYELPSGSRESGNTTPGPETLIPLLAEMQTEGAKYVAMEVSSHALDQRRVAGLRFELAIFTQLTQDHLDYHHDLEEYFQAKRKLFAECRPKHMLINRDCEYGRRLLKEFPQAKSFSIEGAADYQAMNLNESLSGCRFDLTFRGRKSAFETQLPLHYNVSNCTAVLAGLDLLGFDIQDFTTYLKSVPFIPGRMERVPHETLHIFVDYAHTPDAFLQVLSHVRRQKPKRIITVFGCGGDRDRTKRPKMTRVAADYSDVIVMTSDNPRTENPQMIMDEMKAALSADDYKKIQICENLDRAAAIHEAVRLAQPGDAVLVLGKGHEDYQIIGKQKHHFSDREVILEALNREPQR